MAKFQISVSAGVDPDFLPYEDFSVFESSQCTINRRIVVPVPSGQTRYVVRKTIENPTGTVTINATINTQTSYDLQIDDDAGKTSTDFSYEIIEVYLNSSSSEFYYRKIVSFNHGNSGC